MQPRNVKKMEFEKRTEFAEKLLSNVSYFGDIFHLECSQTKVDIFVMFVFNLF